MGAGIAQQFAQTGYEVVLVETDLDAAQGARERLIEGLRRAIEHGATSQQVDEAINRVRFVTEIHDLPSDVDLVVEAVPELMSLKHEVLKAIESMVSPNCILATNTSSLSIDRLAAVLGAPERFLGMHFFNPVPASLLVELVVGTATTALVVDQGVEWVREIGKSSIVVRDSPGFATSRLGVLLGLEAIRMLQEGVASAEDIDRAMELGYRHPMGPLRSTDLVGLDVRLAIAEYLFENLGERFSPPALLKEKVERGELGRKTGQGFFEWH
jgi:3-hydroxybutyryl-CoA dehydrogenase